MKTTKEDFKILDGLMTIIAKFIGPHDRIDIILEGVKMYAEAWHEIKEKEAKTNSIPCDCDRQPLRFNELGICEYCGKQKTSED